MRIQLPGRLCLHPPFRYIPQPSFSGIVSDTYAVCLRRLIPVVTGPTRTVGFPFNGCNCAGDFSVQVYKGRVPSRPLYSLRFFLPPGPPSSVSNMVTPQNCLTPKRLCACSPKVGGPDMGVEKGYVAAIMHTTRTLSVGMQPNFRSLDVPLRSPPNPRVPRVATHGVLGGVALSRVPRACAVL